MLRSVKRQVPLVQAGTADPIMDIIHQETVGNVENEFMFYISNMITISDDVRVV